jgi:hypothetical protein
VKYLFLSLRILALFVIVYLLIFLLSDRYIPDQPSYRPPFILIVLDWINLFIHEAGHLFFFPFGFFVKMLGGSLMQMIIPLVASIVWFKRDRLNAHYFLFWLGESVINVSIYVGDAPYRRLRLISSGALHDWYTLLSRLGMVESAETIASIVYTGGILLIIGSVVAGISAATYQYRFWTDPPIPE